MSDPNDNVLWALDVLRRYAPDPLTDEREPEPIEPQDAEQFFLEEQCPADANFR